MTAREKVANVEQQVREIASGLRGDISCPFCGLDTPGGVEMLCCDKLADTVLAALNHVEFKRQTEILERTMDRMASARCN